MRAACRTIIDELWRLCALDGALVVDHIHCLGVGHIISLVPQVAYRRVAFRGGCSPHSSLHVCPGALVLPCVVSTLVSQATQRTGLDAYQMFEKSSGSATEFGVPGMAR